MLQIRKWWQIDTEVGSIGCKTYVPVLKIRIKGTIRRKNICITCTTQWSSGGGEWLPNFEGSVDGYILNKRDARDLYFKYKEKAKNIIPQDIDQERMRVEREAKFLNEKYKKEEDIEIKKKEQQRNEEKINREKIRREALKGL